MPRWIIRHTRQSRIRNEWIKDRVGVAPVVEKMVEYCFRWFGYVSRRLVKVPVKRVD